MTPSMASTMQSVLVLDDDEFAQELTRIQLELCGFSAIHGAPNGLMGLRALNQMAQPPDLVICDIFMPDMDGIEFIAALVKRRFQGALILMSGAAPQMLEVAQHIALASGLRVLGALGKPLRRETLAQALGLESIDSI